MRKLLISGALLICVSAFVSAKNIELDINYFAVPYQSFTTGEDGDGKLTLPEIGGIEVNANFFFGSPCNFLDVGLNLRSGVGFSDWFTLHDEDDEKEKCYFDNESGIGFDGFFKIGPVVRFNLGQMHSIVVAPGFQLNFGWTPEGDSDQDDHKYHYDLIEPKFDLDIGYRCWLLHKATYALGLDVGTDLQWYPSCSNFKIGNEGDYDDKWIEPRGSGFAWKIYVGVCMNWGTRSINK